MLSRILTASLFAITLAQRQGKEAEVAVHDSVVSSWLRGEQPPPDHEVSVSIVVRIDDDRRAELERMFWEVSDPKHANYGEHKSRDEITEVLAVLQNRVDRVRDYFASQGMTNFIVAPNRDIITATGPVSAVEAALDTQLHFFTHREKSEIQIVRASRGYSLPAELAHDVMMVGELLQFPRLRSKNLVGLGGSGDWPNTCQSSRCQGLVTPGVLSARYLFPNATENEEAVPGNSMSVAEFQGQYFKTTDLNGFATSCGVPSVIPTSIVGGNGETAGVEAEFDIQYTTLQAVTRSFWDLLEAYWPESGLF